MRVNILLVFLLILSRNTFAHTVEQYVKAKNGITLFAIISTGSVEERKMQDAFLDHLIHKLKRRNKNIPIFLLTDQFRLFHFGKKEWFAAISFDTLRSPDPMFLEDYFYYRMGLEYRKQITLYSKPPSNKYQINLPEPIDLGSSYDNRKAAIGIKVMYDYGQTDSLLANDRIFTLVQYAIDNLAEIKKSQKKIYLPYPIQYNGETTYKPQVSILTLDTTIIRNIPLLNFGFTETKPKENNKLFMYLLIGGVILTLLLLLLKLKK